jgi:hypothetical protein
MAHNCPHGGSADRRFFRQQEHFSNYRCRDCDGYYTILTGTVFAKTWQSRPRSCSSAVELPGTTRPHAWRESLVCSVRGAYATPEKRPAGQQTARAWYVRKRPATDLQCGEPGHGCSARHRLPPGDQRNVSGACGNVCADHRHGCLHR